MQDTEIRSLINRTLNAGLTGVALDQIFRQICETIAPSFDIVRMNMGMPTLHPLMEAQSMSWTADNGIEMFRSEHGYSRRDDWRNSPIFHMFKNRLPVLRYRLDRPGSWQRFPLLQELASAGCTEYYATLISFDENPHPTQDDGDGMLVSWATRLPGGFPGGFFTVVDQIKPALGIACKLAARESTAVNIVETYLGKDAGKRVLEGQIERGELITIDTIVWYSDLRCSTQLAENLSNQDFLDTLNTYFECTADSVLEFQGEVLRFIGDAVLAIFPFQLFDTPQQAAACAWSAACQAQKRIDQVNRDRRDKQLEPLGFGLALHTGSLEYGNIGVPSRLEFSVIGTVANEAARLEALTKTLGEPVLVSESFAGLMNMDWRNLGQQSMKGVKQAQRVYAPGQLF